MRQVNSLGGGLAAVLMWVMVAIVCLDVFTRLLGHSFLWVSEVSVYLLIAIAFLGIGYTFDRDGHFAITSLVDKFPRKPRLLMELVVVALSFAFTLLLTAGSLGLIRFAASMSLESPTVLRIPLSWPYSLITIGCVFLALSLLIRGTLLVRALRHGGELPRGTEPFI